VSTQLQLNNNNNSNNNNNKGKGKAHPLQAIQAQRGLGELRLLDFLTSALYGGR
jgi:hypothetical protein